MRTTAQALVEALLGEGKTPPRTWRVAIQAPYGDIPGWVQIDMVDENGDNAGSTSPEKVRAMGYELPDFDKIPQGSYSMGDLMP